MMKFWIYKNHICELRSEELNEGWSLQLYTQLFVQAFFSQLRIKVAYKSYNCDDHPSFNSSLRSSHFHIFKTSSSPFHGFITNQFNENPSRKASFKAMKLTKSSLFLKTMISDFFLSNGAFLNHNPINKSAKNNKRMLIAAVSYFVDAVQLKDS